MEPRRLGLKPGNEIADCGRGTERTWTGVDFFDRRTFFSRDAGHRI